MNKYFQEFEYDPKHNTKQTLDKHFITCLHKRVHENLDPIYFLNRQGNYREYAYSKLWNDIKKYAQYFRKHSVQANDVVIILLPTCEEFLSAFFALQVLKAIPVASYPPTSLMDLKNWNSRVKQQADQVSCKHIVTDQRIHRAISTATLGKEITIHTTESINLEEDYDFRINLEDYHEEDPCFFQFSSGSTGISKAILIKQKNAILNSHIIRNALPSSLEEISVVCWLPLYHDMGLVGCLLMSILNGTKIVLIRPDDFITKPMLWLKAMHDFKITSTTAPNFAYGLVQKRVEESIIKSFDLSHMKAFLCGSEMIYQETMEKFLDHLKPARLNPLSLMPVYGMAESTLAITFTDLTKGLKFLKVNKKELQKGKVVLDEQGQSICCVGKVLPTFEIKIQNLEGKDCLENEVGKIMIKGPCLTDSFIDHEGRIIEINSADWFDTGDEGFFHDSDLYICGRIKETIIIRGKNYYPTMFEEKILNIEGIRKGRVIVSSIYNQLSNSEEIIVLAELENAKSIQLDISKIKDQIKKVFNDDALPVMTIDLYPSGTLLKTSSGKLKRKETVQRWQENTLIPKIKIVDKWKNFLIKMLYKGN
jgi:fatty-acyl-CoA synthase